MKSRKLEQNDIYSLTSLNLKSVVYKNHEKIHPPIELLLNEGPGINNELHVLKEPSFLVFDPPDINDITEKRKTEDFMREVKEKDGLFYYLLNRPEIGPRLNGKRRIFRMLICVTVYSETFDQLQSTLDGVYQNLQVFRDKAEIRNEDIAVVVMFDGCDKVDKSIIEFFEFLDDELKIEEQQKLSNRTEIFLKKGADLQYQHYPKTSCYVYQYHLYPYDQPEKEKNYLQVFFSVKLQNNGKLSSHAFFFRGFCETFQPIYCTLLDCGTIPKEDAIYNCFRAMEGDQQIGGVCGYMGLNVESIKNENGIRDDSLYYKDYDIITKIMINFFDVQKAQKFEYSFAHILDKSFESLFGFIHVLPGAFSAYRWETLASQKAQHGTLQGDNMLENTYLISVLDPDFKLKPDLFTVETANMMLAEDRVLCLEIFTRKNFILKYIPDSICATDPIKYFLLLMKQRRRWINGSWFALNHVLKKFPRKLQKSQHTFIRKFFFLFSMFFAWINQIITFCTIGLYFVFLQLISKEFLLQYYIEFIGPIASVHSLVIILYIFGVGALFYLSLFTQKPEQRNFLFNLVSTFLGLFMLSNFCYYLYLIIVLFFMEDENITVGQLVEEKQKEIGIMIIITVILYGVPSIFKIKNAFTDIIYCLHHYIYYSPAYIHTLLIFAFCNVDDLSWGTKGSDTSKHEIKLDDKQNSRTQLEADLKKKQKNLELIEQNFKNYKVSFVGKWLAVNFILASILTVLVENSAFKKFFIVGIGYFFTGNLAIKSISGVLFQLKFNIYDKFKYNLAIQKNKSKYKKQAQELRIYIQDYLFPRNELQNLNSVDIKEESNKINIDIIQQEHKDDNQSEESSLLKNNQMLINNKVIALENPIFEAGSLYQSEDIKLSVQQKGNKSQISINKNKKNMFQKNQTNTQIQQKVLQSSSIIQMSNIDMNMSSQQLDKYNWDDDNQQQQS